MGNPLDYAKVLIPPGISELDWWRLTMSGSVLALFVIVGWHIGSAMGLYGGDGYARAGDLIEVRAYQLSAVIDEADYTLCMERVDPQIVAYVSEKVREYKDITGRDYEHKPCTLLMKLRR